MAYGLKAYSCHPLTDFDRWWNIVTVIVLVYAVGEYWIITYMKKYGKTSVQMIKHISMFYLEVSL